METRHGRDIQRFRPYLTHFIFIPLLLGGFALALWRLDAESIWHDESWSIRAIQSPFGTPDDNTPPLYYFTLHLIQKLGAGESPFALRYGSVLIHLLTVTLGFRMGTRWYGLSAGAVLGSLLAFSPLLWEYAQEVRAYVGVPFFALLLLGGTDAFLQTPPPPLKGEGSPGRKFYRGWVFLLISELAALYTHNLAVPLVGWVNLVVVGVLIWRMFFPHFPSLLAEKGQGGEVRQLIFWLVGQGAVFVLYLPWVLTQSPSGTTLNTVPQLNQDLLENIWQAYFFPVIASDLPASFILKLQILAVVTCIAGLLLLWRERSLKTLLIFSQGLLLPFFSTLLIMRASIDFHPRYYVVGVPALLFLIAAALQTVPYKTWAGLFLVGFAALISQQSLSLITNNRLYQHDDFAGMAAYYAQLPPDTVILIPYDHEYTFEVYFDEQIQAEIIHIPLYSAPEKVIEKINAIGAKRVEFLTWFQLPADERGMYPCLLAAASDEIFSSYEVYGLSSTGYHLSQPIQMLPLATENNFNGALLLMDVRYAHSAQGVCVQSTWQLQDAPESEIYQTAARLLNPFDWEIAAADSPILQDNQARVADWEMGEQGMAFAFLSLPAGAPAMNYQPLLRLYTPQNVSGLDAVTPENQALGKDLRLPLIALQGVPAIPESVELLRDNIAEGVLYSGQRLQLEILSPQAGEIQLIGETWEFRQPIAPSLNWLEFEIPDDALGEVSVQFANQLLKTYPITQIERIFAPPDFAIPIHQEFRDVANLMGATVTKTEGQMTVMLIWESLASPDIAYQVFVQLLDENGVLLTQSVASPANGQRPTSSWVESEYITDSHNLHLNELEYSRLIVGLFNPLNAERVLLLDGTDFVEIPTE